MYFSLPKDTLYRCFLPSGLVTCRPTPCLNGEALITTVSGSVDECLNYYQVTLPEKARYLMAMLIFQSYPPIGPARCACVDPITGDKECRNLTIGEPCCGDEYSVQAPNDGAFFNYMASCESYPTTVSCT